MHGILRPTSTQIRLVSANFELPLFRQISTMQMKWPSCRDDNQTRFQPDPNAVLMTQPYLQTLPLPDPASRRGPAPDECTTPPTPPTSSHRAAQDNLTPGRRRKTPVSLRRCITLLGRHPPKQPRSAAWLCSLALVPGAQSARAPVGAVWCWRATPRRRKSPPGFLRA